MATNQIQSYRGLYTILGVAYETTFGTPAASGTIYLPFATHDLSPENKLSESNAIRGSESPAPPGAGSLMVDSNVSTQVDVDSIAALIMPAMGVDTVTAQGSGYAHQFSFGPLNSYTFFADDRNGSIKQFVGGKVDSLDISCKPSGPFLEIKSKVMAQTVVVTNGTLSPSYSTRQTFEWKDLGSLYGGTGTSTLAGSAVNLTDFTISLKNNLEAHMASTGGRFLVGIDQKNRLINGTFNVNYDTQASAFFDNLLYGASTGPTAGTLPRVPLVLTFAQPASGGFTPSITFSLGNISLSKATMTRTRNDVLKMSCAFIASESTPRANDALYITVVNTQATPYN